MNKSLIEFKQMTLETTKALTVKGPRARGRKQCFSSAQSGKLDWSQTIETAHQQIDFIWAQILNLWPDETGRDEVIEMCRGLKAHLFKDIRHEGVTSAVKRSKDHFNWAKSYVLGKPKPIPFTKTLSKRSQIPIRLVLWTKLWRKWRKDTKRRSLLLSFIPMHMAFVHPGRPLNLSSIEDRGKDLPEGFLSEWEVFVREWGDWTWWSTFYGRKSTTKVSSSKGVYGSMFFSSIPEVEAHKRTAHLIQPIIHLLEKGNSFELSAIFQTALLDPSPDKLRSLNPKLRRLIGLEEYGLKMRPVTVCDFFSQNALKPVHEAGMRILKRLERDGTYAAQELTTSLKARTAEDRNMHISCFDLDSFTDRLPISLQATIVENLCGPDVVDSWYALMREPLDYQGKEVKFSVGQPMGLLSSWAMATITHHALVALAARRIGDQRPDYYLLGDDIVIIGRELANSYANLMAEIGVKINTSKTLISSSSGLEFCKRLIFRGEELSPIPWPLLQLEDPKLRCIELYRLLVLRWGDVPPADFINRVRIIFPKASEAVLAMYLNLLYDRAGYTLGSDQYSQEYPAISADLVKVLYTWALREEKAKAVKQLVKRNKIQKAAPELNLHDGRGRQRRHGLTRAKWFRGLYNFCLLETLDEVLGHMQPGVLKEAIGWGDEWREHFDVALGVFPKWDSLNFGLTNPRARFQGRKNQNLQVALKAMETTYKIYDYTLSIATTPNYMEPPCAGETLHKILEEALSLRSSLSELVPRLATHMSQQITSGQSDDDFYAGF